MELSQGWIHGGGGGGDSGGQDPPPFWGTPKLHKEGKNVACVCAKMLTPPPLSEILYPPLYLPGLILAKCTISTGGIYFLHEVFFHNDLTAGLVENIIMLISIRGSGR